MAFADAQSGAVIYWGRTPGSVVLAGTVSKGDALGYSGGYVRALAATGSVVQIRCVAAEDGVAGQTVTAYFGEVLMGGARFTGGTVGADLYVAEGSDNGKFTETAPTTSGDADTKCGSVVSATMVLVNPQHTADSTA